MTSSSSARLSCVMLNASRITTSRCMSHHWPSTKQLVRKRPRRPAPGALLMDSAMYCQATAKLNAICSSCGACGSPLSAAGAVRSSPSTASSAAFPSGPSGYATVPRTRRTQPWPKSSWMPKRKCVPTSRRAPPSARSATQGCSCHSRGQVRKCSRRQPPSSGPRRPRASSSRILPSAAFQRMPMSSDVCSPELCKAASAASTMASASCGDAARGFSRITCLPAASACSTSGACAAGGTPT
mmetsp:Transcript_91728/g.285237  ORF Transcript_91728/g.285237 Transcript_91728/m.285237 type:complete len:241 (-) Transcript_91728:340-1062(-)